MKKAKTIIPIVMIVAVFVVFILRLTEWQFIDGEKYQTISSNSSSYTVKIEAARGEILDVNGEVIAGTRTVYNVVMNALEIDGDRNIALMELITLMRENDIQWVDRLPITINDSGEYEFKENSDTEQEYLKGSEMLNIESSATADECMEALISRYSCSEYSKEDALAIISIRYGMTKLNFSASDPYVIAQDVDITFVQIVEENSNNMPAIDIEISSERDYEDGTLIPHIVGSLGLMSTSQYNTFVEEGEIYSASNLQGYSYNDTVGKSGIEEYYEEYLRGENGSLTIIPATESAEMETIITAEPEAGNNVYLTIDSELQEMLNYSLEKNVLASEAEDCFAGAAVVLDVETFGILASATYPTYDLELYHTDTEYYNSLLEDEESPLFDRAFSGIFTSGSVMKPVVAIAALEEGVITEDYTYYCDKLYDYYATDTLKCIGSHVVGLVNLNLALSSSCNSFFCEVGRLLGIEKMEIYANLFGLGVKTGVELSESSGIMTNPTEYEENHGTSWVEGVTIQAAIGQADSMFTPLQLATYCATIANDGVRLETHLLDKITSSDNEEIIMEYETVVAADIGVSLENIELVQEGMREAVVSGTASSYFSSYGIAIAAKTGTAENTNNSNSTTFIAYAPYDDPEIAIAVVIQYGNDSSLSKEVALDLFDSYFFGITVEEKQLEDTL